VPITARCWVVEIVFEGGQELRCKWRRGIAAPFADAVLFVVFGETLEMQIRADKAFHFADIAGQLVDERSFLHAVHFGAGDCAEAARGRRS